MMDHQQKFFNFMLDYCDKNDINTIIQLGDCLDSRKFANYKTLNFVYQSLFDKLEAKQIDFHTLIGNHDVFYKETLEITSSDLLFRNYKRVHVYTKPTTLTFDNVSFDLIPWICEQNADCCMNYISNSDSDYCCGHFAINAFPVIGTTLFDGGLDKSTFSRYKHVFSGHFHIRSHNGNISYIGTPYQLTWSDATTKNGFVVFDTETNEWQYIDNPDRYYFYLTYDDSERGLNTDINEYNITNAFVKVVVKSKNKPFLYNAYLNNVFAKKPADVKIIEQQLIDLQQSDNTQTIQAKDTLSLIDSYIDSIQCDNKESLKAFMASLYNQATQLEEDI